MYRPTFFVFLSILFTFSFRLLSGSLVVIELEHRHERLGADLDRSKLAHLFLSFLLLFKQFLLSRDISSVAFRKNVFSKSLYGFSGDYL